MRTRVGLTSAGGVRSALLLRWFVFHRVAIELGIRQLRCCCFVDDVCRSLYLPTAIFDFDVRPTTSGPERADRGSCAVSCRNDKPAVGLNVPWRVRPLEPSRCPESSRHARAPRTRVQRTVGDPSGAHERGADRGRQRSHLRRLPFGCGHPSPSPPTWPGDYHRLFDDPDCDQTGGAIVRPTPSRLHQLEDDGIVTEQRGQLRWVARIDHVELLGDVTTTWPQNSLVACL